MPSPPVPGRFQPVAPTASRVCCQTRYRRYRPRIFLTTAVVSSHQAWLHRAPPAYRRRNLVRLGVRRHTPRSRRCDRRRGGKGACRSHRIPWWRVASPSASQAARLHRPRVACPIGKRASGGFPFGRCPPAPVLDHLIEGHTHHRLQLHRGTTSGLSPAGSLIGQAAPA